MSSLKYIFVGDNPGTIEERHEEYFYYGDNEKSQTGVNTHNFIKDFLKIEIEKEEILFLNKSLKPTKETTDLYDSDPLEDKSLAQVAQLIKAVVNENKNVFVCIFGLDSFEAGYFESFFKDLGENKNIGLYPHPSRRQPISKKEQEHFLKGYDKQEVFKTYGKLRYLDETKSLIERCKEVCKK